MKSNNIIRNVVVALTILLTIPFIVLLSTKNSTSEDNQAEQREIPDTSRKNENLAKGLMLDVARKFYSPSVIKQFIDELSTTKNSFMQLHLADDENYAVESEMLEQTTENATLIDGIYHNNDNQKPFLSKVQLQEIVAYAKEKNVTIVPEIDMPSHEYALLELCRDLPNQPPVLAGEQSWDTLDYTKDETLKFVKELYQEYLPIFSSQKEKYFHIGCDEFYDLPEESNPAIANFVNELNRFLNEQGFTTRLWNDPFTKVDLSLYDKNLQITYWSQTGLTDKDDESEKSLLSKKYKPNAQELSDAGFKLLNYNGYYLYLVAGQRTFARQALDYTINDLNAEWQMDEFELNTDVKLKNTQNVLGSAMSIWGEHAHGYEEHEVYAHSKEVLQSFLKK